MDYKYDWDKIIVIDIETTGFQPHNEGITEIVAFEYDDKLRYRKFLAKSLCKPKVEIKQVTIDLNGIDNELVKNKMTDFELTTKLEGQINITDIIVAHNIMFEYKWLDHYSNEKIRSVYSFMNWIDTMALTLYYKDGDFSKYRKYRNYSKLQNACEMFGIEYDTDKAHRAEYDVIVTAKVLRKFVEKWGLDKCIKITEEFLAYEKENYGEK